MNKKLLIIIPMLSVLLCNPVSAAVPSINDTNHVLSDEDLKEPCRGEISYDKDMSSSYYIWHKVTATYVFHNDIWYTESWNIWDTDEGNTFSEINQVEPYPIQMLPTKGTENQKISKTLWLYSGEGLRPELVLRKLNKLESKINSEK